MRIFFYVKVVKPIHDVASCVSKHVSHEFYMYQAFQVLLATKYAKNVKSNKLTLKTYW